MLRLFQRGPKTVKVPVNVNNGQVEIQQVRVNSRTRPLVGGLINTILITWCVANTLSWLASDNSRHEPEETRAQHQRLQKEQREQTRKANQTSDWWKKKNAEIAKSSAGKNDTDDGQTHEFLIPIWFRKKQPRAYDMKDPVWQDTQRLLEDTKTLRQLKTRVAQMTAAQFKTRRDIMLWMQYIEPTNEMACEFDVAPRMRSPTAYEVPCISAKPGEQVTIGWKDLSQSNGARIERIFHPVIFAKAFYNGTKAFLWTSFAISSSRIQKRLAGPGELRLEVTSKKSEKVKDTASIVPARAIPDKVSAKDQTDQLSSKGSLLDGKMDVLRPSSRIFSWKAHQARAQSMTYADALRDARQLFKLTFLLRQVSAIQNSRPDICTVVGTVTVIGKKGKLRLNVSAVYAPSEQALIGPPLITAVHGVPYLSEKDPQRMQTKLVPQKKSNTVPGNQQSQQPPDAEVEPAPPTPPPQGKDVSK